MSKEMRRLLNIVLMEANTLDGMRDWLIYYENEKMINEFSEYRRKIADQVIRLNGATQRYIEEAKR